MLASSQKGCEGCPGRLFFSDVFAPQSLSVESSFDVIGRMAVVPVGAAAAAP
mgnify:CR=1 FL=1